MTIRWWEHSEKGVTDRQTDRDRQTDVFQYEQTHNMMQVWTGKLSELQLPVQNSAREALAQVCHDRIDALSPDEYQFHLLPHRNSHHSGGYLVKRWFLPAATRARGQSNDLNREILASNLFNCRKEVINAPPVPSVSRCIHIVYRHKNIWEYQWSNFIYNCMSTFLHYVRCKDALIDCSAPRGETCESLTGVGEIVDT